MKTSSDYIVIATRKSYTNFSTSGYNVRKHMVNVHNLFHLIRKKTYDDQRNDHKILQNNKFQEEFFLSKDKSQNFICYANKEEGEKYSFDSSKNYPRIH